MSHCSECSEYSEYSQYYQCSKQQINYILNQCREKLTIISSDHKINGFIVFLLHLMFQIISAYFLFFYPISNTFYFILLAWIIILLSNIYFRGCILTKLERYLWNTKKWFGPSFICCDLNKWSDTKIQNTNICKLIIITTIIFVRILFKY